VQEEVALQSQREEDEIVAVEMKDERMEQEQEQWETDEMQRKLFHHPHERERPERVIIPLLATFAALTNTLMAFLLHIPLRELQSRRAYEAQVSAEAKMRKRSAKKAEWERGKREEEERGKQEEEQDRIEQMARGRTLTREDERTGRGRDRGEFEDEYETYRRRMRQAHTIFFEGGVHVGRVGDGLGPD
jgi:hypothetical protein